MDTTQVRTVGSMSFCPQCGNLLDRPTENPLITCNACKLTVKLESKKSTLKSKSLPNALKSSLRSKRELVQKSSTAREAAATIKEKCAKCGAPEMSFHTMQLRSADEGQTVFYNCTKCGYKYSINS